jgi:hypothetical protein
MVCECLNTDIARKRTACGEVCTYGTIAMTSRIIAKFLTVASSLAEKLTSLIAPV